MDELDKEALASDYKGEDDLDREALNNETPEAFEARFDKCPYCGNTWDSKYTNHSICGLG